MGYCISQGTTKFTIKRDKQADALEALNTKLAFGRYHWANHAKHDSLEGSMEQWSWDSRIRRRDW